MKTRKRIVIVSTFSGMDLFMLAFIRAWALPGYGLEKNIWAALMHAANFHYHDGTPVMQFVKITKEEHEALKANKDDEFDSTCINGEYIRGMRIQEANGAEVRAEIERRFGKDVFILAIGGPPCQDICAMNRAKREGERNRNNLLFEYSRFIRELAPDAAIMEEAEELSNDKNYAELFDALLKELKALPFHVAHLVMNSLHYGSNQQRVRTIVMMVNKSLGKMPVFPQPDLVNVKRVRDFLDVQYFHSGNFTDKLKTSAHFMCTVTSGAPAYFIRNGVKAEPTIDELLLCFDVNKGEYLIPSNIPKQQIKKAIGNAVSVAMGQKLAEVIFEKILCVKHVGDNWFEPINDTDSGNNSTGNGLPVNVPGGDPAPETPVQVPSVPVTVDVSVPVKPAPDDEQGDTGSISKDKGFVLYHGPSAIDGGNIVAIATLHSNNVKTGDMVQLWLLNADVEPLQAIETGADKSVCGNCRLRHYLGGACYVEVPKGPDSVYMAWKNGAYPFLPVEGYGVFAGRGIRFGAYGDPAAIPFNLLEALKGHASTTTGYTHQWREEFASPLKALAMASVDNMEEYTQATAMGWRTFRIIERDEEPGQGEVMCVNSTKGVQCLDCGLCAGNSIQAKNITIVVHGANKNKFNTNLGYAAWVIKNGKEAPPGKTVLPATPSPNADKPEPSKPSSAIRAGEKKIINSLELIGMEFDALSFTDAWADFLGQPSPNFNCVLTGMPGEGKSTFAIQFAQYLADNFGRVIYVSGEEGISKTFRDKFVNTNSGSQNLDVVHLTNLDEVIRILSRAPYKYVFIDSLDCMKISEVGMRQLRATYKATAFITISQSTKDGQMRGSNQLKHDSDIAISVENGIAITTKNRFREKGKRFFVFDELNPQHYYEATGGDTLIAESDMPPRRNRRPRSRKPKPYSSMTKAELNEQLKQAVEEENYEEASKIRDEISRRQKQ